MKPLLALLLLMALTFLIVAAPNVMQAPPDATAMRTALSVGLLMLGAWLAGHAADAINLPRISGYLIIGMVFGPDLLGLVPAEHIFGGPQVDGEPAKPPLQFASDLAIALIALTAGGELRFSWLRSRIGKVAVVTLAEMTVVWALVGTAVFIAEAYVPVIDTASFELRLVMAILVGLVAASNSPAVVMALISETRARGPLSQTTLAITIFKDMTMVVVFAAALALGKGYADPATSISAGFMLSVSVKLIGSLIVGALIGVVMAWYVDRVNAHLTIFIIGCCLLFALLGDFDFYIAGEKAHFETLLVALGAGLTTQNLWPQRSGPMFEQIESMSLPVFCLFFALAGAKLDLEVIQELWYIILILVAVRAVGVWASVTVGGKLAGLDPAWRGRLWYGFIPQAGVSLALATLIAQSLPFPGVMEVDNVLIGMIAIHEIVGPIGFRIALLRSGEADPKAVAKGGGH